MPVVCFADQEALQNWEALLPDKETPRHQVKGLYDMGKTQGVGWGGTIDFLDGI